MKKIVFLNGSPKKKRSMSDKFLKSVEDNLKGRTESEKLYLYENDFSEGFFENLCGADAVVVATPLYVDCLPSRVLEFMSSYRDFFRERDVKRAEFYFIINCGFLEYSQNDTAIKILKRFAETNGFIFIGGVSIGSGAMILQSGKKPTLETLLEDMTEEISKSYTFEDMPAEKIRKIKVDMPRFLFKAKSDKMWIEAGAKKGLRRKDLKAKCY